MKKNKKQQLKQIYLQRIKCNCVAQKHQLINNCLSCGKVVCAREGEGPCLYCGKLVVRPDGKYIADDDTLFPSLSKDQLNKVSQEKSKAILHKNTLIERDQLTSVGHNIYDEHIDYYDVSENQWLDEEDRKKAVDKILQRDKVLEQEKFKQRIVFDEVLGKFVTQDYQVDNQQFKKEGRQFMQEKQKKQYLQKIEKKKKNWDTRMLTNEKMQEIITQIIQNKKINKKNKKINKNYITQFIIEQDIQKVQQKSQILKQLQIQQKYQKKQKQQI